MWRKNRLTQLGIPDLQYMHKIFLCEEFQQQLLLVYTSQSARSPNYWVSDEDARATVKRCVWHGGGRKTRTATGQNDCLCPLLGTGWSHSLSPNTELAHEGHKLGETQILPWPNRSHCFSCTFLYLFPQGIYQPHLLSKLWPSRNSNTLTTWCKESIHWKRSWCWKRLRAGGEGGERG